MSQTLTDMLLDSVAPEVKTISFGSAPMRAPISLLGGNSKE